MQYRSGSAPGAATHMECAMNKILIFLVAAAMSLGLASTAADAGGDYRRSRGGQGDVLAEHPRASTYRRSGPQVRGYVKRGGYSYNYADSMLDYRDRSLLTQGFTGRRQSMPFDNDFFFDSGVSRNNSSPYLN
jgi:hypothetical protein